jgi:diguanylate cyclase (GGDEF)-like protein/PAS domain S-box-containing protein
VKRPARAVPNLNLDVQELNEEGSGHILPNPSQHPLESLFDISPDGILITDAKGVICRANPRSVEMFGYTPAEFFSMPFDSLLPERFRIHHPSHRRRYTAQPTAREMGGALCLFGLRKDGTEFPVDIMLKPIETASGTGVMSFVRDMTEQRAAQESARRTDQQFRSVVESISDYAIYLLDKDGHVRAWNPGAVRMKGFSEEQALGLHFSHFFTQEDQERGIPAKLLRQAAIRGQVADEGWRARNDGTRFWADSTLVAVQGIPGEITGYAAVTRDATERKRAEDARTVQFSVEREANSKALRASEERYRNVFHTSPEAVSISRMSDGGIVDINQAFLNMTGYSREEVIGRTTTELRLWLHSRDRLRLIDLLRHKSDCQDLEFQFRRKNKEVFWARLSATLVESDGAPSILAFARDISEAKVAEEKIWGLAFYDPLTGLANRRLLIERLTRCTNSTARTHRKRAVLFIDLDDFKALNDTLGHHVGDLMLQEVARRLVNCIRETDIVGRMGGDEFVVILEDLSEASEHAASQAKSVAEKILAAIALPYMLNGHDCRSASSIGITVFGDHDKDVNEVVKQADIAMYQAKETGRNTVRFFASELEAAVNARASAEDDIRQAIQKNQFVLYYQPQVDSGVVIGAEALLRWDHPVRGIVLPDEFIPLAEKTGLILFLGNWALESACTQIATWASNMETSCLTISVNISVKQMRHPGFVEHVLASLEHTGANPNRLRLELTESMFVENFEEIIAKMKLLKAYGLRFSVDDFGTGYSSLSYLKRLPIDELKIERSFVHDIATDVNSGAIAESLILLSRALGLSVIAEGVETEAQRDYLARLGCSSYQGWLFSRPLPINEFQSLCQA